MSHSNFFIVIAALIIVIIFLGGVFLNIEIKKSKEKLDELDSDIDKLLLDIKRQDIEISALTSPVKVIEYIEKNNLQNVNFDEIEIIRLKND